MNELPRELYRTEQSQELDRLAIEVHGIASYTLMERAGRAAYRVLRRRWPEARRILIVCGGGNNAGDGYVVARFALRDGLQVRVLALVDPVRLQGAAATAAKAYLELGQTEPFRDEGLGEAEVIVDALLGTGLDRPVQGRFAQAIETINATGRPVLAIDIPSGIRGDTGQIMGIAVRACATPTFIALKRGLFTGDAPGCTGEVTFSDLEVPTAVTSGIEPAAFRITAAKVNTWLPPRGRAAHKGHFGHVLIVGGDRGMGGAVRLAAEAAGRLGAGLVTAATRVEHVAPILAARPEVMCHGIAGPEDLEPLFARATVVVLGPGLGRGDWGRALFERCIAFDGPLVIDADGLNLLAQAPQWRDNWVLTPHPGEAARLLGCPVTEVQADRFAAVEALQSRFGGVAVLKGAGSLIRGAVLTWLCDRGNPGMASGGMGDVLSGVIGGLLAQGLNAEAAAVSGVWLHAHAADRAAMDGERGLLATDLFAQLRRLANQQ
ncbi:MAG TPA: NAD(P)H-hydrate dehydratase [Nitrococcus sp.]|nr:NAD(P)H-hydrate dehydratase [Nitrococcus sp.]